MPGQMWWLGDEGGVEHPDASILLAYTCQQNLGEDWPRIRQHIAQCKPCLLRCNELMYSGKLLTETLAHFQYSQSYPSLAEGVVESIQYPPAARLARRKRQQARLRQDLARVNSPLSLGLSRVKKMLAHGLAGVPHLLKSGSSRPGKSPIAALSIFSIPLLVGLLLVAVVIALAFSISTYGVGIPFHPSSRIASTVSQPNLTVPAHSTGTARPANNAAVNGGLAVTATVTPANTGAQPAIRLCTGNLDKFLSVIRFCGSNFTPGDKVELWLQIAGSNFRSRHLMTVGAQGTFQYSWTVFTCKDYFVAISVKDITHPAEVAPALQSAQVGQCFYRPYSR
jgi:hypothetical protein